MGFSSNDDEVEFDLDAETNELRNRSAINSSFTKTIGFTIIFSLVCLGVGIFAPEVRRSSAWWGPYALAAAIFIGGGAIAYNILHQSKQLVKFGVVVKARLQAVTRLPKGLYRITVFYKVNNRGCSKTFTVASLQCGAIEGAGFVLLAVLQSTPKIATPLYNYATRKELFDVMTGKRGLAK